MDSAAENEQTLRGLVALVRHARTFGHRSPPLYWREVVRLRALGLRYLSQVDGVSSPKLEAFGQLLENAFAPPVRLLPGFIRKEEMLIDPGEQTEAEKRVSSLNKLDLDYALQILIEAAHRLRTDMRRQSHSLPAREPAQDQTNDTASERPQLTSAMDGGKGTKQHAQVNAFIERVLEEKGERINRTEFWRVAGYTEATQFERWQRGDRVSAGSATKFNKVLKLRPEEFLERLKHFKGPK